MKKRLKDPDAVTYKSHGTYPFDFKAPTYDNRTSGSISAGDYYGSARNQPVGKESASGVDSGPVPQSSKCWSPKEVFSKEDKRG